MSRMRVSAPEIWALYEDVSCARGEMENRIKEQLMLFADRTSTATMRANQLRLNCSSIAYVSCSTRSGDLAWPAPSWPARTVRRSGSRS